MTSIGERLRRQRLQSRMSLEKIALDTKIGVRLLEAIEAEQFEKLPGGVFRRSFVLQYARALGVDPDEIADELKQLNQFDEVPAMPAPQWVAASEQSSGSGFSFRGDLSGLGGSTVGSLLAAVGVMLGCALIYSWWQTPREEAPVQKKEIASAQPSKQATPAAPRAAERAQASPAETPTPTDGANVRVGLSAGEKTWISISSDGKNVFANSLEPHQTKVVEASEKVRLLIGNAGGLEISLNGKPIGPVGPKGQIRVVELTAAGFQIVPRKSPTPEPL
jgi:cytoskeleton protein RodZ